MKEYLFGFLFSGLILFCTRSYSQDQNPPPAPVIDPLSTVNYFEFETTRINFYSVDDSYNLIEGTIYTIDRRGFKINLGWDSVKVGDDYYIIITYPSYIIDSNGGVGPQNEIGFIGFMPKETLDSINVLLPDSLKISDKTKLTKTYISKINEILPTTLNVIATGNTPSTMKLADFKPDLAASWKRVALAGKNGLKLCIKKSDFDKLTKTPLYSRKNVAFSSGQLTVPFKLRGASAGKEFSMTTDVTIGAYGGAKMRLSKKQPYYLTLPVVIGLTFINVNDNTSTTTSSTSSGVYPGWTIATGLIGQIGVFNLGFVVGWDFASGVGKSWIYQGKHWVSFGLGYSFLK